MSRTPELSSHLAPQLPVQQPEMEVEEVRVCALRDAE